MKALVLGAGGFIGSHMVNRLIKEGYSVWACDLKEPDFEPSKADVFIQGDLRDPRFVTKLFSTVLFDEVYQFAADMGGAGYIFTGEHDAEIMHNSATINLNVAEAAVCTGVKKLFYSSSACIYPAHIQDDPANPGLREEFAYPANPDSEYGWEKIFSERLYQAYRKKYGLDVRIARFHNIFGPLGTYIGGKEKAPAAICRKVAEVENGGTIEVWGDGDQTRSFLYIDECIEGVRNLMSWPLPWPNSNIPVVNIGSNEMVSINELVAMVLKISKRGHVFVKHDLTKPQGVRGRNSQNDFIWNTIGWRPSKSLEEGLIKTYDWINRQVNGLGQW